MPQPGTLRAIAEKLLKVSVRELEAYFNDELSLEQLLAIRPKIASLEEVYTLYASLPETEKDIAIALILRDRADAMGNALSQRKSEALQALVMNISSSDKQSKTGNPPVQHKLVSDTVRSDTDMSQMGDYLNSLERYRLSILLQQGVANAGYPSIRAAVIGLGFQPKELGMRALNSAYLGEEGWRIQPKDWIVIAALCPKLNESQPWLENDLPNYAPSASTYRGDVAGLKRDLACCEVCRNKRFKRDKGVKTQIN